MRRRSMQPPPAPFALVEMSEREIATNDAIRGATFRRLALIHDIAFVDYVPHVDASRPTWFAANDVGRRCFAIADREMIRTLRRANALGTAVPLPDCTGAVRYFLTRDALECFADSPEGT